ncbi:hypothetical protein HOK51_11345 [Candidatus Woesearchaeota archaeon]|nr:hypothetical protein [Candidatus Woesearchaeota archaeon]MBT7368823.1 hypothetical protein [Candidatus Woesearchaeota archaeon]
MFNHFKKKSFGERLKDTGYLFKHSFTIIGKDKDIKTPIINMVAYSMIMLTILMFSILLIVLKISIPLGVGMIIFSVFILGTHRLFFNVRQKADQSWIVYNTLIGKDVSYDQAHTHTKYHKGKLRFIAFIDVLMTLARSQRGNKKGIIGVIITLALTALVEVWDLLIHYMIPAVVIEQKKLKEIIPEIKSLKNNIPATLAGVFGIDFAGQVVGSIMFLIYLFVLAISVGIGWIMASLSSVAVVTIGSFSFSWIPVFVMFYIVLMIGAGFGIFVESIKIIYFTIFYMAITRPNEITPDIRNEVTHYLRMEKGKKV